MKNRSMSYKLPKFPCISWQYKVLLCEVQRPILKRKYRHRKCTFSSEKSAFRAEKPIFWAGSWLFSWKGTFSEYTKSTEFLSWEQEVQNGKSVASDCSNCLCRGLNCVKFQKIDLLCRQKLTFVVLLMFLLYGLDNQRERERGDMSSVSCSISYLG